MKASDFGSSPNSSVGQWGYALSEDGNGDGMWSNFAGDREGAIAEALALREENDSDTEFIYVAQCREFEPSFDVDSILDTLACRASDECGEVGEGWPHSTKAEDAELEAAIIKAVGEWLTKTNNWPTFCTLGKVEKVPVLEKGGAS